MLDNLVVERFREGHNNIELKKHLCLYPSTGLQDLIGACVRFETHVELGARSYKPNEGMYAVKGNESAELSFDEVARAARKLGYQLRPWVDRQENRQQGNNGYGKQDNRGYGGPYRYQNGGNLQQGRKFTPTETQACAHLTDARHLLKRSNAGHVVNWDIMHQTVPQLVLSLLSRLEWSE